MKVQYVCIKVSVLCSMTWLHACLH